MKTSPFYAIVWVSIATFGLIGVPRFFSVFSDLLSVENDSLGVKSLFAAGVLFVHLPYLLALIFSIVFHPRRIAFTKVGILGSVVSSGFVVAGFASHHFYVNRTYPVVIQFVDHAGERVSDLPVVIEHKVEGFTPTTSPKKTIDLVLNDGLISVRKSFREVLIIQTSKAGMAYARVEVLPMGGRYPVGPLQKVDMSWFIDPKGGKNHTYTRGSKNWSFAEGTLIIPIPAANIPLICPIPKYAEEDWMMVSKTKGF
jgi:hypothetical protein